jgi:SAM-dependent methyltransferase
MEAWLTGRAGVRKYREANRQMWNAWTPYHVESGFYDVEGFKQGQRRDRAGSDALEIEAVGDVAGKSLLHLQCHFGLDTLAWARRGATVTGVDFAEEAIKMARALAVETGIPATFVHSDIYDLPERLGGQFDIIFTSHGILSWLPDLRAWAQVIAHFLRPRGVFHIIEAHPFAMVFDDARGDGELRPAYPYFHETEPTRSEGDGSYAAPTAPIKSVTYQWAHSMGEIVNSLIRAGLRIESLDEYPFVGWAMFPWMIERPDGFYELPPGQQRIPLMFALKASKPTE